MIDVSDREWVERCVATMVFFHKDGASAAGKQIVEDEADELMAWVAFTGFEDKLTDAVLVPLERELVERFGADVGGRLCGELAKALTRQAR